MRLLKGDVMKGSSASLLAVFASKSISSFTILGVLGVLGVFGVFGSGKVDPLNLFPSSSSNWKDLLIAYKRSLTSISVRRLFIILVSSALVRLQNSTTIRSETSPKNYKIRN